MAQQQAADSKWLPKAGHFLQVSGCKKRRPSFSNLRGNFRADESWLLLLSELSFVLKTPQADILANRKSTNSGTLKAYKRIPEKFPAIPN